MSSGFEKFFTTPLLTRSLLPPLPPRLYLSLLLVVGLFTSVSISLCGSLLSLLLHGLARNSLGSASMLFAVLV
jgi:hypothetical protein